MDGGVYTDGSRIDDKTAAATITMGEFLGRYATVMDADLLGVAMGWEIGDLGITDSQAAIGRIKNMQLDGARGWVEQRAEAAASQIEKKIAWVKRHSGVMGNKLADLRAKKEVWKGSRPGSGDSDRDQARVQGNMEDRESSGVGPGAIEGAHLYLYR